MSHSIVLFAERVEDGGRKDLASRLANLVCDNDTRLIARQSVLALINLFPVKPVFFTPFLSIILEQLLSKIAQVEWEKDLSLRYRSVSWLHLLGAYSLNNFFLGIREQGNGRDSFEVIRSIAEKVGSPLLTVQLSC